MTFLDFGKKFYTENIMGKIPNKASEEVMALYWGYEGGILGPILVSLGAL
ncbi:hypothetical protein PARA125_001622 [Parachlamydia sp. AcF125]|nr:hypothetical protein [Parachlamydia sp. AcF125]